MNAIQLIALLILILEWNIRESQGANILALLPTPSPSHHIWSRALTTGLAARGHHITVISPHTEKKPIANYSEFIIEGAYERLEHEYDYESMVQNNYLQDSMTWFLWGQDVCDHALGTSAVKKLLQLKGKKKFDLVIIDQTVMECFLVFVPLFDNPPIIAITAYVSPPWYNEIVGNPQVLSCISTYTLPYGDHMTLTQRIANVLLHNFVIYYRRNFHLPAIDDIVHKHFGSSIQVPSEIEKNISMVMVNTHFSLDYPRPAVPALVEVGGMQVRPGKQLPKEIKKFIDEAEHGAIFFSLGSNLRSDKMAKHKINAFIAAISELPQRVLWKWESDSLPNKPKNLLVGKWLPQNDILAHPNVKLFISHSGMLSTQETVYHGVPVVGVPFLADQHFNIIKLVTHGLGEHLDYRTLSKESILQTVRKVLSNPSYKENMKRMSALYRDQPQTPQERAVFWAEYVMRHKGAPHLRSQSVDMPLYQYLLLDVIAVLITAILVVLTLLFLILRTIYRFIFSTKNKKVKQQ